MKEKLLKSLIGGKVAKISRVCDLICIQIESESKMCSYIDIQCFFRALKDNEIIISSDDIYRCDKRFNVEEFAWDIPGQSVFDKQVQYYSMLIFKSSIVSIQIEKCGDLIIGLENNIVLQIMVNTSVCEENFRIFNDNEELVINTSGEYD